MTPHEFLKQGTDNLHRDVENSMRKFLSPPSRENYVVMMQSYHRYYSSLNQSLSGASLNEENDLLDLNAAITRLENDLAVLGAPTAKEPVETPQIEDRSDLLGLAYVLNGSQLGAKVIRKMFLSTGAIQDNQGDSFLNTTGEEVATKWRSFLATLNNEITSEEMKTKALASAIQTFETIERSFITSSAEA